MTIAPVSAYPNATDVFILDTDASDVAIGAALSQRQGGEEHPIAYGSKVLHPKQRAYCTTRKELLAVVVFTAHFRHYILGRQFVIRTDHASLVWLMRFRNPVGQVARWLEALSCYDYIIQHRSGGKHVNADGLSRIPVEDTCQCYIAGQKLSSLPCRGCTHCSRLQSQWQRFKEDVDDVILLSVNSLTSLLNHQPLSIRTVAVEEGPGVHGKEVQDVPTTTRGDGPSQAEGFSNYIDQLGPENLRKAQMEDHNIRPILLWLESGLEPSEGELKMQSDSARHYWLHRAQLEVWSGVLYYIWFTGYEKIPLLVVTQTLKPSVLTKVHDSTNVGHLGQTKTYQKAQLHCYWFGLNTDVKLYVATCATCNQNKGAQHKHWAPLTRFQAGLPGEGVHLEILGPFLESSKGNRYVLIVIDQFTRWLEMVPLPVQDAESVAKAFFKSYVVRFGVPITVHTDQGRNFESDLFKAFCHLLEIAKTQTTPYRPSANGQVERYNQLVLNHLRCYIQKDQRDWDTLIPALGLAIRSTVNRSTGFTPNMLQLCGSEPSAVSGCHPQTLSRSSGPPCTPSIRRSDQTSGRHKSPWNKTTMWRPTSRALRWGTWFTVGTRPAKWGSAGNSVQCSSGPTWLWKCCRHTCTAWRTANGGWCCTMTNSSAVKTAPSPCGSGESGMPYSRVRWARNRNQPQSRVPHQRTAPFLLMNYHFQRGCPIEADDTNGALTQIWLSLRQMGPMTSSKDHPRTAKSTRICRRRGHVSVYVEDGHCHLQDLARRLGQRSPATAMTTAQELHGHRLISTVAEVVDNQVFPNAWGKVYSIPGVTIGTCIRVHPRMVNNYIPWNRLEALIRGPRCVG